MFPFSSWKLPPARPANALRSRRRGFRGGSILLVPLLAFPANCRAPAGDRSLAVLARFGDDSAPSLFASARVAREATVARWTAAELRRRCEETSGTVGTTLAPDEALPEKFLVRCDLQGLPGPIDGLEIELLETNGGALRCQWTDGSTRPGPVAAGELAEPERGVAGSYLYRIARPDRDQMAGAGAILCGAETRSSGTARWRSLRAISYLPDPDLAEKAVRRRWTIGLGAEWRDGVPALPGHPVLWRVQVPAGARLRFGYAAATLPGARFRVRAGGEKGEVFFASPEEIPGAAAPPWREAEVDLARLANQQVELRFEVEAPGARWSDWGAWGSPLLLAPAPAKPHILLISVDTLRADHLSLYGFKRPTSPFLDSWAARSAVVFDRAFVQAPWTLPSHVSMLTGLEPFRHGVELEAQAPRYRSLANLATALAKLGYLTEAVTGGGFVHPRFGFSRGFDRYRFWPAERDPDDELAAGVDEALRLFDDAGTAPRFLFLHTYEVHPPNRARQPYFSRWSDLPSDLEVNAAPGAPTIENGFVGQRTMQVHRERSAPLEPLPAGMKELPADLYDSAIAYLDTELHRLFEGLRARGALDRTLVVVTSDHGESLGEWGRWNHAHLDTANLHVPLLIAFPDRRGAGTRISTQVRSIDIAPTILAAVVAPSLGGIDGESLLDLVSATGAGRDRPAWAYGSSNNRGIALLSADDLQLVFQDSALPPIAGETTAFDLAADPGGLIDVSARQASKIAAFRGEIERVWAPALAGVRVEFDNAGNRRWRGILRSSLIEATSVKSFDVANGEWTWAGRGKSRFEVRPERRFAVLLQDRGRAEERIVGEIEIAGCDGVQRFEVVATATAQVVEVDPANCRLAPPRAGTALVGIRFQRQGLRVEDSGFGGSAEDAAAREQLRALGYL